MDSPNLSPTPASQSASAASIVSLVLGILAVVLSFFLIGIVPALIGLGIGLVARGQGGASRRLATWGAGLSALGLVFALGVAALGYWMFTTMREAMDEAEGPGLEVWEGVQAPELTVNTIDGRELKLSDLRGKRVIIDFWATWCGPCVQEIPHFAQLYRETSRDQLEIVGISDEETPTVEAFAKKHQVPYPLGSAVDPVAPFDDISALPTTFFLDRRGVIQTVLVGYHDLETLRSHALAPDTEGEPRTAPARPESGLKTSALPLEPVLLWNVEVAGARGLGAGDLDGDGTDEILVGTRAGKLRPFSADGTARDVLDWPADLDRIEVGRHRENGARLLGYSNWGDEVRVFDRNGAPLWSFPSRSGINGAHWGDLDGDGTDEMVVGQNGNGGLQAVSAEGKTLWSDTRIGNVWNQAIVPANPNQPARIFATEAGGSIRVYDAAGKSAGQFRLDGQYCAPMSAARLDADGSIQVIGETGRDAVAAADENGQVAWKTPVGGAAGHWREGRFVSADVDGDGVREWIFQEYDHLVVVSPAGEKRASVPVKGDPDGFTVARRGDRDLLVVRQGDQVQAYGFQAASETSPPIP